MDWTWDHLKHFLALARSGSLTTAGSRLGVSHTTILRRVRALEQQLDTRLFDVTDAGWCLTPTGTDLLTRAEQLEDLASEIGTHLRGTNQPLSGPIVLAAPESLALTILPPVLATLRATHPHVEIDLRVSRTLVDLDAREADLALRVSSAPPQHLIGRKVGTTGLVAAASVAYCEAHGRRFPEEADGHRFVRVRGIRAPWAAMLQGRPEASMIVDCFVTAGTLCRAGLGIAEVPDLVVARDPGLVGLERAPNRERRPIWLLVHPTVRRLTRVRRTADALFEALRAEKYP